MRPVVPATRSSRRSHRLLRTITSVTTRKEHVEDYLWNWNGWNGNVTTGGVGSTSFSFYIKGTFKECAAYCFHSASNWLKTTVCANGSATYAWG